MASGWIPSQILVPLAGLALLGGSVFFSRRSAPELPGRATVVYAHPPCPPDLMVYFDKAFDAFRRSHPDIDLRVLRINSNYEDKIKVMFAGKVAPDVIFMYANALPAWVDLGAIMPLDDLLATHGKSGKSDYFPAGIQTYSYRGRVYALPKDASAEIVFYNSDMFKKLGLPPPGPDWNWSDLVAAAGKIARDTDGDGRTDVFGVQQPDWQMLVRQFGGRVLSDDGSRCVLDSPEAIRALEFWVSLRQTLKITPTPEAMTGLTDWRLFALERCGMFISFYAAVPMIRKSCDFNWDIAPLPHGPAGDYATYRGSAFAVTTQSRHPHAAFEWARWMTGEGMRYIMTFDIPANLELGRSNEWRDPALPPASKQVAVDAMKSAGPQMQHPDYFEIIDAIQPHLDRANRGLCTVPEAVKRIVPAVNAILARRQLGGGKP